MSINPINNNNNNNTNKYLCFDNNNVRKWQTLVQAKKNMLRRCLCGYGYCKTGKFWTDGQRNRIC